MKSLPIRYLYLVDLETDQVLAIFSVDHYDREGDIIAYEDRLRIQHGVDSPDSGIVLRDSLLSPLDASTAMSAQAAARL